MDQRVERVSAGAATSRQTGVPEERAIELIGVACGLGAPMHDAAGCARAAQVLRDAGIAAAGRRNGAHCDWTALLAPGAGTRSGMLHGLLSELADSVARTIADHALPVVIGGDHAIAAGTWRGAARAAGRAFGLIWIDAHLDAHTPTTSPSGNIHGMPLAALLGIVVPGLSDIEGPPLNPRHLCIIGTRSFEEAEIRLLRKLGVWIFEMADIERRGLRAVLDEALGRVRQNTAAFGISIDLDALDPREAPGVSTPAAGGLDARELCEALRGVAFDPKLAAVEIAEYNPERDIDGRTATIACDLVATLTARSAAQLRQWEDRYGAHNYAPLPVVLTRGEGIYLWDTDGHRYMDLMAAYSAVSFGHAQPRLVGALARQAKELALPSRAFHNDRLPLLLRRLHEIFGYDAALPVNTGLEAVETALKAARKWAYKVKGVEPDKAEIIACRGNFHGRSTTIVGMSSEPQYRDGFGPFPTGMKLVPYDDAAALEAAITPRTAAFIVEPIQGEGGIIVPRPGYLAACAEICRRHNVLLLCDEVQTGLGRTGKLLASWHEGVHADGIMLGKALGGGLLPVSAFLADRRVMDVFNPGDHGSTFGGNPLAAAVALEALDILVEQDLAAHSAQLGRHLVDALKRIETPLIREVRGRGLFVGIEIDSRHIDAWSVCLKLLDHGILTKDTHGTVVRLAPPLTITADEIDWAVLTIAAALAEIEHELPRAA